MSAKVVRAIITQSKMRPHLASIRAVDGGDLRLALTEAGFQVGDEVAITLAAPDAPHIGQRFDSGAK